LYLFHSSPARASLLGCHGGGLTIGADYMLTASSAGTAQLYQYAGAGTDWTWVLVSANAQITFPDTGTNFVAFDQVGLGGTTALTYRIDSMDQNYNLLYTSYAIPLSLNNTGFVYNIENHVQ
jgi:hypothetical protein